MNNKIKKTELDLKDNGLFCVFVDFVIPLLEDDDFLRCRAVAKPWMLAIAQGHKTGKIKPIEKFVEGEEEETQLITMISSIGVCLFLYLNGISARGKSTDVENPDKFLDNLYFESKKNKILGVHVISGLFFMIHDKYDLESMLKISNLTGLRTLTIRLFPNGLTTDFLQTLPKYLERLETNKICHNGFKILSSNCPRLKFLSISDVSLLKNDDWENIPKSIAVLVLNGRSAGLGSINLKDWNSMGKRLTKLKYLELYDLTFKHSKEKIEALCINDIGKVLSNFTRNLVGITIEKCGGKNIEILKEFSHLKKFHCKFGISTKLSKKWWTNLPEDLADLDINDWSFKPHHVNPPIDGDNYEQSILKRFKKLHTLYFDHPSLFSKNLSLLPKNLFCISLKILGPTQEKDFNVIGATCTKLKDFTYFLSSEDDLNNIKLELLPEKIESLTLFRIKSIFGYENFNYEKYHKFVDKLKKQLENFKYLKMLNIDGVIFKRLWNKGSFDWELIKHRFDERPKNRKQVRHDKLLTEIKDLCSKITPPPTSEETSWYCISL
jgi:hypothetical protein